MTGSESLRFGQALSRTRPSAKHRKHNVKKELHENKTEILGRRCGRSRWWRHRSRSQGAQMMLKLMKLGKTVSAVLAVSVLLATLTGCQKQEGPAEHAGKEIDKATEKAGQQIEKVGDSIQDAAKGDKK
jgi:hypothetical protein